MTHTLAAATTSESPGGFRALTVEDGRELWRSHSVPNTPEVMRMWEKASLDNPPTGGEFWTTFVSIREKQSWTGEVEGGFGKFDPKSQWKGWITAIEADNGKEAWQTAGQPVAGGLISYRAVERQRVAVAAGMKSPIWPVNTTTARVVVFGLP